MRALRAAVGGELGAALAGHLTDLEIDGIARRCDRLLARGSMPAPARAVAGDPVAAVLTRPLP